MVVDGRQLLSTVPEGYLKKLEPMLVCGPFEKLIFGVTAIYVAKIIMIKATRNRGMWLSAKYDTLPS